MTKHNLTPEQRFFNYVPNRPEEPDTCWNWIGSKDYKGYGNFTLNGQSMRAHRAAYVLFKGPIPEGLVVMHACDNPSCVRPSHLSTGTYKDNMADMVKKGRSFRGKGDAANATKLTEADRVLIRGIMERGWMSAQELADKLGVCTASIYRA